MGRVPPCRAASEPSAPSGPDGWRMLQLLDRDLDVNLRGREFGMTKELVEKADIRAAFRHQRDGTSGRVPSSASRLFELEIRRTWCSEGACAPCPAKTNPGARRRCAPGRARRQARTGSTPTADRSRSLHRDVKFPAILFGVSSPLPELSHKPADTVSQKDKKVNYSLERTKSGWRPNLFVSPRTGRLRECLGKVRHVGADRPGRKKAIVVSRELWPMPTVRRISPLPRNLSGNTGMTFSEGISRPSFAGTPAARSSAVKITSYGDPRISLSAKPSSRSAPMFQLMTRRSRSTEKIAYSRVFRRSTEGAPGRRQRQHASARVPPQPSCAL